ncbi:MAG: hypothetical protein IH942_06110 [Acidobacteria bacterium]|nr:hypothetical protein [Acidobacteriota bacterium]
MTQTLRTFALQPENTAGKESWTLVATTNDRKEFVARFTGKQLERNRHSLAGAVANSKHPRTILSPTRKAPVPLTEDAGVRLALIHLTTGPIAKPDRSDAIRYGIDAMSSEEALYWYAYCTGPVASRALRALRTLLAEE